MSAFQKRVCDTEVVLRDHICKEMNPLNLERCRCIPKNQPGADWRVLQQIVEEDPSREKFEVGTAPPPRFEWGCRKAVREASHWLLQEQEPP